MHDTLTNFKLSLLVLISINKLIRVSFVILQIAHFLEDSFIGEYTDNVRELAGHLNTLAKIVRNDNQRNMGLHLFDEHLG